MSLPRSNSCRQLFAHSWAMEMSSHQYIKNRCFLEHLKPNFSETALLEAMNMVTNLKKLSFRLEYHEADTSTHVQQARELALKSRPKVKEYATNRKGNQNT